MDRIDANLFMTKFNRSVRDVKDTGNNLLRSDRALILLKKRYVTE